MGDYTQLFELGQIKWTTKDKQKLTWADMAVTHLINCVKLLKRREHEWEVTAQSAATYSGSGDMAMLYATQAVDEALGNAAEISVHRSQMETYIDLRKQFDMPTTGPKPRKP